MFKRPIAAINAIIKISFVFCLRQNSIVKYIKSNQNNCSNAVGRNKYYDTANPGENIKADSVITTASKPPPNLIVISPQNSIIRAEFI